MSKQAPSRETTCIQIWIGLLALLILLPLLATVLPAGNALADESIILLSTQFTPMEEAAKVREILKNSPHPVDFMPVDDRATFLPMARESSSSPVLLGGLYGDFRNLLRAGVLADATPILNAVEKPSFIKDFVVLGKLGGEKQYVIPWAQATYIMAANRKALKFLPDGADINALTYAELAQWAKRLKRETGKARLGFPVGKTGLMHRFLQGYLYPSFTGSTAVKFKSESAIEMWKYMQGLWENTSPNSLTYSRMSDPLLSGDIWVAWDHTARLMDAVTKRPDDFVVFPAPAGPKGRGFMVVLAGLGISRSMSISKDLVEVVKFLATPETQLAIMRETGFFPVVKTGKIGNDSPVEPFVKAVARQAGSKDALIALLPEGLGKRSKDFNSAYMLAFSRIILRGKDITATLNVQGEKIQQIFTETGAPCWPPDTPGAGGCMVE